MSENIFGDWIERLKKGRMLSIILILLAIIIAMGAFIYIKSQDYKKLAENGYNQAFYELVEYVNTTEKLLKKSTIANSASHEAKILTTAAKTATLAQTYLSRIPIESQELENTNKFLSQVSDYCYTISKKNFKGQLMSNEELENLNKMHEYSIDLENTLNTLENDLYSGQIKWGQLTKKGNEAFENGDNNLSKSSFENIEEDLHQYTGLIYDGAFSEKLDKKIGLVGEDVDESTAMSKAKEFLGNERIKEMYSSGESENAKIQCYTFNGKINNDQEFVVVISKKGGHVVMFNVNRNVDNKIISENDAIAIGKEYLSKRNYNNMKETYYLNEGNILTINYAYQQDDITVYPDLIKVKIALDNGETLGIEATNYLNCHQDTRNIEKAKISQEEALKKVNSNVNVIGIGKAIIPTEWDSEIFCYEIKGNIKDKNESNDFIVYINAQTGEEEDILMVVNTPNGTLTA